MLAVCRSRTVNGDYGAPPHVLVEVILQDLLDRVPRAWAASTLAASTRDPIPSSGSPRELAAPPPARRVQGQFNAEHQAAPLGACLHALVMPLGVSVLRLIWHTREFQIVFLH
jgi:hypothetical protein